ALFLILATAALLTTARPAAACETDSPDPGLSFELDGFDAHPVAEGGALLLNAQAYGIDIDAALATLVLWEVRRDGVVQPGSFEVVPLWDAAATSVSPENHKFALIWRPDAPFTADGVYTVDFEIAGYWQTGPQQAPLRVVPAEPPALPYLLWAPSTEAVDPSEVICCETGLNSCGTSTQCEATRATLLPALYLELELDAGHESQILWVARASPGGEIGPRVQGRGEYVVGTWRWTGTVRVDAEQYCVVVGVTSVTDGSEVVSEPLCHDQAKLGAHTAEIPPSARMSLYDPANPGDGRCIGPIVYEADGAAYPRGSEEPEASGGCDMTAGGGSWLVLLVLLALIRRRRARA
ncbi:MAG TPA: hypothetical protein VGB85_06275, partial [Nannocystis sp.]